MGILKIFIFISLLDLSQSTQNHECSEFSLGGCNDGDSIIFDNDNVIIEKLEIIT